MVELQDIFLISLIVGIVLGFFMQRIMGLIRRGALWILLIGKRTLRVLRVKPDSDDMIHLDGKGYPVTSENIFLMEEGLLKGRGVILLDNLPIPLTYQEVELEPLNLGDDPEAVPVLKAHLHSALDVEEAVKEKKLPMIYQQPQEDYWKYIQVALLLVIIMLIFFMG